MQLSKFTALAMLAGFCLVPTEASAKYACAVVEVFECTALRAERGFSTSFPQPPCKPFEPRRRARLLLGDSAPA
jgi:hypothetical protein